MSKNVTLQGVKTQGINDKTSGNAQFNVNCNGVVEIKDCDFGQDGYNCVEIGLKKGYAPKHVIVENCDFTGVLSNNAISVYGWQDGANIIIRNCNFGKVSNVLRFSNKLNTTCNVILENITVEEWVDNEYAGLILMQDYTSLTEEEAIEKNLFGEGKMNISFKNVRYPNGDLIAPEYEGQICVGGDMPQVVYVYRDKGGMVSYDESVYPTMTFQA